MKTKMKIAQFSVLLFIACLSIWLAVSQVYANSYSVNEPRSAVNRYSNTRSYNTPIYIHPARDYSVPAYKSDTQWMIESYERMMSRNMDLLNDSILKSRENTDTVMAKLSEIEQKIDTVNHRLARIEKALNIEEKIPDPPKPEKK